MQQEKLSQFKPKGWGTGPSTSKKETGFDKIETVDTDDYDKLIKKWLVSSSRQRFLSLRRPKRTAHPLSFAFPSVYQELQAENRKAGVEKTTMMYKVGTFSRIAVLAPPPQTLTFFSSFSSTDPRLRKPDQRSHRRASLPSRLRPPRIPRRSPTRRPLSIQPEPSPLRLSRRPFPPSGTPPNPWRR